MTPHLHLLCKSDTQHCTNMKWSDMSCPQGRTRAGHFRTPPDLHEPRQIRIWVPMQPMRKPGTCSRTCGMLRIRCWTPICRCRGSHVCIDPCTCADRNVNWTCGQRCRRIGSSLVRERYMRSLFWYLGAEPEWEGQCGGWKSMIDTVVVVRHRGVRMNDVGETHFDNFEYLLGRVALSEESLQNS